MPAHFVRVPSRFKIARMSPPDARPHVRPVAAGDHVFLVDGSSFVFRAYFQSIRQDARYNYRSDRLPTGAVRLFCNKLFQFVRDGAAGVMPTHLAIIFDKTEQSFRKELYPPYKSNRNEPPDELVPQFPLMREAVRAFGLLPVEQDRYEADDLIATYARQARARGADVLIVSADKDLMQLIGPGVWMYDPASGIAGAAGSREERMIGEEEVFAYFGVAPDKVIDVQALAGDSTDNVPGARGIGVKTAAQLVTEYGSLDALLARAGEIKQPKRREALTDPDSVALIQLSRTLVTLDCEVEVETALDDLRLDEPDAKRLVSFFKALEFTTLAKRAAEIYAVEAGAIDPDPALAGPGAWRTRSGEAAPPPVVVATLAPDTHALTPATLAAARMASAKAAPIDTKAYVTITDMDVLDRWIAKAHEIGRIAIDTETATIDPMQTELLGIALAIGPGEAAYVPLRHTHADASLFAGEGFVEGQLAADDVIARLKPLLEHPGVMKVAQNIKFDWIVLKERGIDMGPLADPMLASYVLDAGRGEHGLDHLSQKYLGHTPLQIGAVAGTGRSFVGFARVGLDKATEYAGEDADTTWRLWHVLSSRLPAERMATVYETLERPLVTTLARMERRGIAVDRQVLSRLSGEFAQTMARLEADIFERAEGAFNLGSTKQIAELLFGKLGLPGGRKTATGAWSTAATVLDDLAEQGHELPAKILAWRQVAKLKSTYTDALPGYVNPRTGRVHTSFQMASTTTGRLSSQEPNLQNIPIRTEEGRKIRRAFIAAPGNVLVSADYSQIELRLLAHIADIPQLRAAFANGDDIHAMTASEMFSVPLAQMTPDIRRRAKAINFGIIYGISAFGLANQLAIPREEAGAYIKKYFERFPGIRDYMDATKMLCREQGFVTTLLGRRCHYPRITSSNPSERAFNERAAINAPIQGSAADIIRRAMVRMDAALAAAKLDAKMLLQVHDELVFEVPQDQVAATIDVVRRVMVDAPHPVLQLAVPLAVDAKAAANWDEAH